MEMRLLNTIVDFTVYANDKTVIVNYIPNTAGAGFLLSLFGTAGSVVQFHMVRNEEVSNVMFAFVTYSCAENAANAVQHLHGRHVRGTILRVRPATPSCEMYMLSKVIINGLPKTYTEQDLVDLCRPFGRILQANVNKTDGFGSVKFQTHEEAVHAIEALHGVDLQRNRKRIVVKLANAPYIHPNAERSIRNFQIPKWWVLFVGNLTSTQRGDALWKMFGQYGLVFKVEVVLSSVKLKGRGFAFVTMKYFENAVKVIEALNGTVLEGRILTVAYARNTSNMQLDH